MKSSLKRMLYQPAGGACGLTQAAHKSWTGKISDSMCGGSHAKMIAQHTGAKMTEGTAPGMR